MSRSKLLPLIVLQIVPLMLFPPAMMFSLNGLLILATLVVLYGLLGYALMRGRGWALTTLIWIQGMNVIVRFMMLLPNTVTKKDVWDVPYAVLALIAIAISFWLMLRLDRPDIRSQLVS